MAGRLKKKVRLNINLFETTNNNRIKTGGTLTAYIYPGGIQLESTGNIPVSPSTQSFTFSGRGALDATSHTVGLVRESDADFGFWERQDIAGETLVLESLIEEATVPGRFTGTLKDTTGSGYTGVQVSDRLVSTTVATLYEDEGDEADTISQASGIDVPTNGVVEFYVEDDSVDVYLTGDTIDDGWYAFNVPAGASQLGPLSLQAETASADASGDIFIDSRTGVLLVDSAANNIDLIRHGHGTRLLVVLPLVASVTLDTSTSTTGDGHIYDASGGNIVLDQYVPILLVCHEGATAADHYWTILGTPKVSDFALDELTDVVITSPSNYHALVYDGANWIDSGQLGAAATPLTEVHVTDDQFYLQVSATIAASFDASGLSASRIYTFPDVAGTFVLTDGQAAIGGLKTFDDSSAGFRIKSLTGSDRIAVFDASNIADSNTETFAFPATGGTFALTSDAKPSLEDLSETSIDGAEPVGWPLVKTSTSPSNFDIVGDVGTLDDPLSSLYITDSDAGGDGLHIVDNSTPTLSAEIGTRPHTANRTILFPDTDGNLLVGAGDITETKSFFYEKSWSFFFDDTANRGLFNVLANVHNGILLALPEHTTIRVGKLTYEWILDAASTAVTPRTFNIYYYGAGGLGVYTPGTTIPPTGGTTSFLTNFSCPGTGVSYLSGTIAGIGLGAQIDHDEVLALGMAGGTNGPGVSGVLNLTLSVSPLPLV
jgi:hypothetical protein